MTDLPRYTGPEQGRTGYPPKDTAWMVEANCQGLAGDLFFPEGGDASAAKAVCRRCTVRDACLEYALTPPVERWGIYGGLTDRERRGVKPGRPRKGHGTRACFQNGCRRPECVEASRLYHARRRA